MRYGIIPQMASLALSAISLVSPAVHAQTAPAQTTLQQPPPLRALLTQTTASSLTKQAPSILQVSSPQPVPRSLALLDDQPEPPTTLAPRTYYSIRLESGESYTDVHVNKWQWNSVQIIDGEKRIIVMADQIAIFRRRNPQMSLMYGTLVGTMAGCIAALANRAKELDNTFIGIGVSGGATLGLVTAVLFRPQDDVLDLRGVQPSERWDMIPELIPGGFEGN